MSLRKIGDPNVSVSLESTSFKFSPNDPIEIGFRVSCDIPCSHPRFKEILEFFATLGEFPSISDAQKILGLLQ